MTPMWSMASRGIAMARMTTRFHPAVRSRGTGLVAAAMAWLAIAAAMACAAETHNMRVTLSGVRLGSLVSGSRTPPTGIAHRVVAIEFWDASCALCADSLPKLEELHKKYAPAGLVAIAAFKQGSDRAAVKKKVGEAGVTFAVVDGAEVAGGMDFTTTNSSHLMVFDHTGACVFRGTPADGYDAIAHAVRAAPASILEGRTLEKLALVQKLLEDDANVAVALRKAKAQVAATDEATTEEARYVVEKVEAFGRRLLEDAEAAKASDPLRAAALVRQCAADFKGTPLGTEALAVGRDMKKDKAFQDALAAVQQFTKLQAMRSQLLSSLGADGTATPDMVARVPSAMKQQMADLATRVQRHLPGSRFAREAADIALEFGLDANGGNAAP